VSISTALLSNEANVSATNHAVGKIPTRIEYDEASVNCRPVRFHIFTPT
jgi:hypothetical protein